MASKTPAHPKLSMPTGTVTFLFSDIVQSTERWESHRDAMKSALKRHDSLLRRDIKRHCGTVFKTVGDAFCAAFACPESAVAAAVDAQRSLSGQDWKAVGGLHVRIAVHTGTAHLRGGDYFGTTVNRVARVLALAHGGQILITDVVAQLSQNHWPPHVDVLDLGPHRLRGLNGTERLYQILAPGLPSEFPPLASIEAHPNNLPRQLTSFIGRDEELARISTLLNQSRLVTIVGSGGIGKTRSALQIGSTMLKRFTDGVWFVDLAPIREPKLVISAIAQVLGVDDTGSRPLIDGVVFACKSKRTLLIFDNCEHVLGAAAEIARRLLADCGDVAILATSREALCIEGECKYRIPSMSLADGVALFESRAQSSGADFTVTADNAAAVQDIVHRVDAIALGIEIAASRVSHFGLTGLASHLNRCLNLPAGAARSAVLRQQTMNALIDWSYGLLNEAERVLFRQLAVFRGGMTLDASINMCVRPAGVPIEDWDVLALLGELVEKSLLVVEAGDEPRYRMLESTREYAVERLNELAEADATVARHCRYYAAASARAYDDVSKMNFVEWLGQTQRDLQNYRGAIQWGLLERHDIESGAQIVSNLLHLWYESLSTEGQTLLKEALAAVDERRFQCLHAELVIALATLDRLSADPGGCATAVSVLEESGTRARYADALLIYARVVGIRGHGTDVVRYIEEALSISRELDRPHLTSKLLPYLSYWYSQAGQFEKAAAALEEALSINRRYGDDWRMTDTLNDIAESRFQAGDIDGAIAFNREALSVAKHVGYQTDGQMLANLAAYLVASGDFAQAWKYARESLDLSLYFDANLSLLFALQHLAHISAMTGGLQRAAYIIGYVDAMLREAEGVREVNEARAYNQLMRRLQDGLDAGQLSEAVTEGARATRSSVVAQAMLIPQPASS